MRRIYADKESVRIRAVSVQSVVNQHEIKHVKHYQEPLS